MQSPTLRVSGMGSWRTNSISAQSGRMVLRLCGLKVRIFARMNYTILAFPSTSRTWRIRVRRHCRIRSPSRKRQGCQSAQGAACHVPIHAGQGVIRCFPPACLAEHERDATRRQTARRAPAHRPPRGTLPARLRAEPTPLPSTRPRSKVAHLLRCGPAHRMRGPMKRNETIACPTNAQSTCDCLGLENVDYVHELAYHAIGHRVCDLL